MFGRCETCELTSTTIIIRKTMIYCLQFVQQTHIHSHSHSNEQPLVKAMWIKKVFFYFMMVYGHGVSPYKSHSDEWNQQSRKTKEQPGKKRKSMPIHAKESKNSRIKSAKKRAKKKLTTESTKYCLTLYRLTAKKKRNEAILRRIKLN